MPIIKDPDTHLSDLRAFESTLENHIIGIPRDEASFLTWFDGKRMFPAILGEDDYLFARQYGRIIWKSFPHRITLPAYFGLDAKWDEVEDFVMEFCSGPVGIGFKEEEENLGTYPFIACMNSDDAFQIKLRFY